MSKKLFVNIVLWVTITLLTLHIIQYAFNKGYLLIVFCSIFVYVTSLMTVIFWRMK